LRARAASKIAASPIRPVLVLDLGQRIATHYDKLLKCEDKAGQHKIAIGQLLAKAKEACDAGGFTRFRKRFCPDLGKSRIHISTPIKRCASSRLTAAQRS
jgi:hypothetical protein